MIKVVLPLLLLISQLVYAQTEEEEVAVNHPTPNRVNKDPWNIYYGFNKPNPLPESLPLLDTLVRYLKDNPLTDVEIYSYTDGKGNRDYNINLSQHRALAVIDYLVKRNIDTWRIVAKEFGSRNFVAYEFTDKGKDNPQGRALNRRSEIRIQDPSNARRVIMPVGREFDEDDQTKPTEGNTLIPLE